MPKRILQPTQRWNVEKKENCPNRAVLDPCANPQAMTYRPLGRKRKKKQTESIEEVHQHETSQAIPPQSEE